MEDRNSNMDNPINGDPLSDGAESKDASPDGAGASGKAGKVTKKALTSRGVILIGIGGLLAVLLIIGAAAWYTRISTVNHISMDAAQFDFKANYTAEDFIIRAEDYINVYGENKAAPGTAGVIPIRVSAGESNVDVNYLLTINTTSMDDTFKKRIRFFYIPYEDKDAAFADGVYHPEYEKDFSSENTIKGSLKSSDNGGVGDHFEYIYWEWVYDLNPYRFYDVGNSKWWISNSSSEPNNTEFTRLYESTPSEIAYFDEIDTNIGLGRYDERFVSPDSGQSYATRSQTLYKVVDGEYTAEPGELKAYQTAMEARIDITGAMATPIYDEDNRQQDLSSGNYGSAYIDLKEVINAHNAIYPPGYFDF